MDECRNCIVRGDIGKCMKTNCNQHDSWMVGELKKALAKSGCHDIFCDLSNRVCRECPAYIGNTLADTLAQAEQAGINGG
jgi:hypothetical protein